MSKGTKLYRGDQESPNDINDIIVHLIIQLYIIIYLFINIYIIVIIIILASEIGNQEIHK